jgi:hypothetical protein
MHVLHLSEGDDELEDEKLYAIADPSNIRVPSGYSGPHIQFPMTVAQLQHLIACFKKKQVRDFQLFNTLYVASVNVTVRLTKVLHLIFSSAHINYMHRKPVADFKRATNSRNLLFDGNFVKKVQRSSQ